MKKIFTFSLLFAFLLAAVSSFAWTDYAQATTPHIIINEIQIAGTSSNDEFIELFNPTDTSIVLDGYKLSKKTKGGSESTLVSTTKFSGTVQAHGYFLIAHPNYKDEISADLSYSSSSYYITSDNTVFLYDKEGTLLDKVGFGAVAYSNSESSPALNPDTNQSIERTNFIDTDNNASDFSINTSPSPRNKSVIEDDSEELPAGGESPGDMGSNDTTASDASDFCAAKSSDIKLNEIFPYPESGEEFAEVVNTGGSCVDISGWKIMDEVGHKKEFPENSTIGPGEYFFLEGNLYLNNDSDIVYLLGRDGSTKGAALDSRNFEKAQKGFSYSLDGESWQWTSAPTPGAENIFDAAEDKEDDNGNDTSSETTDAATDENIYLSEILPNPKDETDNEYIEIVNGENGPVDLRGWMIRDGSKHGKYVFKEHVEIGSGEYLAIYKLESRIALNNSNESVYLYDPAGKIVSSASYEKSQKNASYNFDGNEWRWSKYLTPGKKNQFDSEPTVKINKPKRAYKDLYTEFSAKAKDKETKKLKYVWDFGDGKKSYLAKTSHKYQGTGKYTVTLTVSDDSQTVEKSFVLAVKNYPRPDLEIVKIIPNPAGNDTEGEIVEIKNNSGKKIDLQGWKIATGSEDQIYNHPISDGIIIDSNETKTITREMCKFSLNNKVGKIQLVMPDGKVIDKVEYSKEKIAESEAYVKTDGEWQWIAPNAPENAEDSKDAQNEESEEQPNGEILGAADENQTYYAQPKIGYTSEDEFIFLKFFGLLNYRERESNFCPVNEIPSSFASL